MENNKNTRDDSAVAVAELIQAIPEAQERSNQGDLDLPYVMFAHAGSVIKNAIEQGQAAPERLKKWFSTLNLLSDRKDVQIDNMMQASLFEILWDDDYVIEIARAHLRGRALSLFENAGIALRDPDNYRRRAITLEY
jgi:hypothetical protein